MSEKTYEVDNVTGINHEGVDANKPVERLTATSIIEDDVVNIRGDKLGKIDNLMINLVTGKIEYVVLDFGSFLGIGGKLFAIPFSELRIKTSEHAFILDRDKAYLKSAPGFDKDHWPDTNDRYFDDVNGYYRITSEAFIP